MPSENNHIDNFFRLKVREAAIENTRLETDWKHMQTLLSHPDVVPDKKDGRSTPIRKYLAYAAGLALVAFTATLVIVPGKKKTAQSSAPVVRTTNNKKVNSTVTPIPGKEKLPSKQLTVLKNKNSIDPGTKKITTNKEVIKPVITPENIRTENVDHLTKVPVPGIKADSRTVFTNFYNELKKQSQEFIINNHHDTTIRCKEGTVLFIPAGIFQSVSGEAINGDIKIAVTEFYSYADIISNKLSTTSNGQSLETGGMLNIQATSENREIKIRPGAAFDLRMPTRVFDSNMQLFTGQITSPGSGIINAGTTDTVITTNSSFTGGINWMPSGQQQFFFNENKKIITILDLRDEPYAVVYRKNETKSVAKFAIPFYCKLSTAEIQKELEKRYGKWYDVIKVKREWKPLWKKNRNETKQIWYDDYSEVGDSIKIPLHIAARMKLITREDSIQYEVTFRKQFEDAVRQKNAYSEFLLKKEEYNFRISGLGWINCDRFLGYPRSRLTDFVLNPGSGFEGTYFQSLLIFDKERSAMPGVWINGKINFYNLPVGHTVHVICTGARDGKMFATVQRIVIEKFKTPELQFEETSPEGFRRKLSRFGSVTKM